MKIIHIIELKLGYEMLGLVVRILIVTHALGRYPHQDILNPLTKWNVV